MATHSGILAGESQGQRSLVGDVQPVGSQRVKHTHTRSEQSELGLSNTSMNKSRQESVFIKVSSHSKSLNI